VKEVTKDWGELYDYEQHRNLPATNITTTVKPEMMLCKKSVLKLGENRNSLKIIVRKC
jgi:hypothetical protein